MTDFYNLKYTSPNFFYFTGLEEFEEKIDKLDKDRDGSHPWLKEMLHNLRKAKKNAENGDRGLGKEQNHQKFSNQDAIQDQISF